VASQPEIVGIQYLRGIGAATVVVCHTAAMATMPKYMGARLANGALENADSVIDLFFLISGFIITIVSLNNHDLKPRVSIGSFFKRRFQRIIPLMWVAIILFALLRLFRNVWHPSEYLRALFLWPWGVLEPLHIWTLRQELVFYVVFAVSMLMGPRWRFVMGIWIAGPAILWWFGLSRDSNGLLDPLWLVFSSRNFEFVAGFVMGVVWLKSHNSMKIKVTVNPVVILGAYTLISFYVIAPLFNIGPGLGMALLLSPILLLAIYIETEDGPVHRLADLLGNASYSIYLFHPPVVSAMLGFWSDLAPTVSLWIVVITTSIAAVFSGVMLHLFLERPLLTWLRSHVGPKRRQVVAA
jgi:exopolysaccharide production protein ExoZ